MSKTSPRPGRPPTGEIEKRKRRILEVATKLFIENGFEKTTVAAISKAAGVTKRTIYDHIGDKDVLFRTVCMERLPQSLEQHFELRPKGQTTREALKSLAQLTITYSTSEESIALTRLLMVERLRFPDLVRQSVSAMHDLYEELIERALGEMADAGLLPSSNNPLIAGYFYDIVVGNSQIQMLFDVKSSPPGEKEIEERIDIFLNGFLDFCERAKKS